MTLLAMSIFVGCLAGLLRSGTAIAISALLVGGTVFVVSGIALANGGTGIETLTLALTVLLGYNFGLVGGVFSGIFARSHS